MALKIILSYHMLPLTVSIRLKFNPHLECFIAETSSFAENIALVSTATFCWTLRTLLRMDGVDERQRSSHLSYIRVSGGVWSATVWTIL